jgi:sterol desaturase/sphingolipid hydroxylase (fatty acid hydroxylase superfamily)
MWSWSEIFLIGRQAPADIVWSMAFWGFFGALAGLEDIVPGFRQQARRGRRWPTNFGFGLTNALLSSLVPVSALVSASWAHNHGYGILNQFDAPWVTAAVSLAALSLAGYAVHLSMHKIGLLWRLHRVHHMDTQLDLSTSFRSHPTELLMNILFESLLAIGLGLNPSVVAAYAIVTSLFNLFTHTNIRLPGAVDRSLRWLFMTPNMHCLHHSSLQPETDSNYGQVFTVWDRLFGTFRTKPRSGFDGMQFGLESIRDDRTSDFWWQTKSPFLEISTTRLQEPPVSPAISAETSNLQR